MRILHLIYDHPLNPWIGGGGSIRAHEIAFRLRERGHQVLIVSGNFPNGVNVSNSRECFLIGKSNSYLISTFSYTSAVAKKLDRLRRKFDIIVEDFAPWNPLGSWRFQNKQAVVIQIQNYLGKEILNKYSIAGIPFYVIEELYPKLFNHCIVINEALNERWRINGNIIPQGVPFVVSNVTVGDYVAYLGRIDFHQKGLDMLLEIAADLKMIKFRIAGYGRDEGKLRNIISKLDNVEMVGKVWGENKWTFIRGARFMVIPSRFEGQSIVAVESAAMGKPAIVSDIPELAFAVKNGFAISFKKGSSENLKEKIQWAWESRNWILEGGYKGIEYAKGCTWDKITDRYETCLYEILKDSR